MLLAVGTSTAFCTPQLALVPPAGCVRACGPIMGAAAKKKKEDTKARQEPSHPKNVRKDVLKMSEIKAAEEGIDVPEDVSWTAIRRYIRKLPEAQLPNLATPQELVTWAADILRRQSGLEVDPPDTTTSPQGRITGTVTPRPKRTPLSNELLGIAE